MSFSFEFRARNKADALHHLSKEHAPNYVRDFCTQAIVGIAQREPEAAIHVKAHGHLTNGADYLPSTATIEVLPIHFVAAAPEPAPKLEEGDGA